MKEEFGNSTKDKDIRTTMGLSVGLMEKFKDCKWAYRKKFELRSISNQEFLNVLLDFFKTNFGL